MLAAGVDTMKRPNDAVKSGGGTTKQKAAVYKNAKGISQANTAVHAKKLGAKAGKKTEYM